MAMIIYPAAFHADGQTRAVVGATVSSQPVERKPLTMRPVRRAGGGADGLRAAVGQSLKDLHAARDAIATIDDLGRSMGEEAQAIETASAGLGTQMDRLLAETRRMTAYLRGPD